MEEGEILKVAKELGVEDEEIEGITGPYRRFFNPVFTSILGFLIGFIIGMFFPKVTTNSSTYPFYRSFPPGTALSKRKNRIIMVLLGIISAVFGFIISSQFVFSYSPSAPDSDGILYGVFTKELSLNRWLGNIRKEIRRL
ncbi:MAG: hypothetical protein ACFE7E_03495 [Candidatus Hodarchaeota archaeon]